MVLLGGIVESELPETLYALSFRDQTDPEFMLRRGRKHLKLALLRLAVHVLPACGYWDSVL